MIDSPLRRLRPLISLVTITIFFSSSLIASQVFQNFGRIGFLFSKNLCDLRFTLAGSGDADLMPIRRATHQLPFHQFSSCRRIGAFRQRERSFASVSWCGVRQMALHDGSMFKAERPPRPGLWLDDLPAGGLHRYSHAEGMLMIGYGQ